MECRERLTRQGEKLAEISRFADMLTEL
jgi:hypothetical protein